jgi:hypothetical protein
VVPRENLRLIIIDVNPVVPCGDHRNDLSAMLLILNVLLIETKNGYMIGSSTFMGMGHVLHVFLIHL